jgi:hypothetical protein
MNAADPIWLPLAWQGKGRETSGFREQETRSENHAWPGASRAFWENA